MIKQLKKIPNLTLLDQADEQTVLQRCAHGVIFSPICPDYHFKEVSGPQDRRERVHDFDGMGKGVGIVYQKLIRQAAKFFSVLDQEKIDYKHILLVADVECQDKKILQKLSINQEEFIRRCKVTTKKINRDLEKKSLKKSNCFLMSEFFTQEKYDFYGNIGKLTQKILNAKDRGILNLVKEAQRKRLPLHQFWFGISEKESRERTIKEMAMYASFGYCPKIDQGVILCADSEILSHCYNLFKASKTPVIYIVGSY